MAELLSSTELADAFAELEGWHGDDKSIHRDVAAPTFLAGIGLVSDVGAVAEQMNHHPNIDIRWRTVTFTLSTHDAGGVTDLDLALARRIDSLIEKLPAG